MKILTPFVSFLLVPLLVTAPLSAQVPTASAAQPAEAENLQIRMLAPGADAAILNCRASNEITVQVTDPDGAPVANAAVALRLPDSGATGTFSGGSHSAVAYTDASGRAHIAAVQWGETPGMVAMRVTAVKGTVHAGILVEKTLADTSKAVAKAVEPVKVTPAPPAAKPVGQLAMAAPATDHQSEPPSSNPAPAPPAPKQVPAVSVVNSVPPGSKAHSSKKWLIIAAIAAGAGAGFAMAGKGKSSAPASSTPSLSIGTPSISVGHP